MSTLSDQTIGTGDEKRASKFRAYAYLCFGTAVFAALPMWYFFGEVLARALFAPTPRTNDKVSLAVGIVIAAVLIKLAELRPRVFVVTFGTMNIIFLLQVGGDIWVRFFRAGPLLIGLAFLLACMGLYLQRRSVFWRAHSSL